MRRITMSGTTYDCTANVYPWPHGHGVQIDIATSGKRIGCLLVLCAFDQPDFHTLAALSPSELCDLALTRFADGQLSVTLERVLWWQETISSMGYDYVSPIGTRFSRAGTSETGPKVTQW
jgi:hypothetical protein